MSNKSNAFEVGYVLLLVAIMLFGFAACCAGVSPEFTSNQQVSNVKVKNKESVTSGKSHNYLIFTEQEVFTVKDSTTRWFYNSSDVYNQIQLGSCYNFTVYGFRSPFLSEYRRIFSATEVACQK